MARGGGGEEFSVTIKSNIWQPHPVAKTTPLQHLWVFVGLSMCKYSVERKNSHPQHILILSSLTPTAYTHYNNVCHYSTKSDFHPGCPGD